MVRKQRIKAAPSKLWSILGFVISIALCGLAFTILAMLPWELVSSREYGPPERISAPLVSGLEGWFVFLLTIVFTGLGLWLDRGRPRRIEPLARVAACLSVLGTGEAIYAARLMAPHVIWPVNLIDTAWWLSLAAIGVGVISLVRLQLARGELRGWVFAICSIGCSAGAAYFTHLGLIGFYAPLPEDGIELPLVNHSMCDWPSPDEYRPEVRIGVDGPEELPDFAELAERMKKAPFRDPVTAETTSIPDEPVLIRADARAKWSAVREVIEQAGAFSIWKVQAATRWEQPATQTKVSLYLPLNVADAVDPDVALPEPPYHVVLHANGRAALEDEESETDTWSRSKRNRRDRSLVWIEPDDDVCWQDVLSVLEVWMDRGCYDFRLGSFSVQAN